MFWFDLLEIFDVRKGLLLLISSLVYGQNFQRCPVQWPQEHRSAFCGWYGSSSGTDLQLALGCISAYISVCGQHGSQLGRSGISLPAPGWGWLADTVWSTGSSYFSGSCSWPKRVQKMMDWCNVFSDVDAALIGRELRLKAELSAKLHSYQRLWPRALSSDQKNVIMVSWFWVCRATITCMFPYMV